MDNSIYSALAGQVGTFNNMNTVANNVSNANTSGYKSDTMVFNTYLTKDVHDNNTMPQDFSTVADDKTGAMHVTSRPLDVAISGQGMFIVQTPVGVRYTRNGNFQKNADNILVTAQNYPVLSIEGNQVVFQETDTDVRIYQNGAVYAIGPTDTQYQPRGVIGVAAFSNPKLLRKAGDNLMTSDVDGVESDSFTVTQGVLEDSNVEGIMEMTRMIELQRKAEMTSSLIEGIYSVHKTAYRAISKQN